MKLLVVLTLPFLVFGVSIPNRLRYQADCLEKSNLKTRDLVELAKNSKIDNPAVRKFPICFYEKMGYMEDGKVNMLRVKEEMMSTSGANVDIIWEPCKDVEQLSKEPEENALTVFQCFLKSIKQVFKSGLKKAPIK